MRKILVGFDGSEGSEHALNRAMMLIDEYGLLILIAVIPKNDIRSFVDSKYYENLKTKAENLISNAITDLGEQSFEMKGVVEEGDAAAKIIDASNKMDVDLIVLGSRGKSKISNYPIGSVANKVVQYAHKPVMVVR